MIYTVFTVEGVDHLNTDEYTITELEAMGITTSCIDVFHKIRRAYLSAEYTEAQIRAILFKIRAGFTVYCHDQEWSLARDYIDMLVTDRILTNEEATVILNILPNPE